MRLRCGPVGCLRRRYGRRLEHGIRGAGGGGYSPRRYRLRSHITHHVPHRCRTQRSGCVACDCTSLVSSCAWRGGGSCRCCASTCCCCWSTGEAAACCPARWRSMSQTRELSCELRTPPLWPRWRGRRRGARGQQWRRAGTTCCRSSAFPAIAAGTGQSWPRPRAGRGGGRTRLVPTPTRAWRYRTVCNGALHRGGAVYSVCDL